MSSTPSIDETFEAIRSVIQSADPETGDRVYFTDTDTVQPEEFHERLQGNLCETHFWLVEYVGILERREDDAGDLFFIRHSWNLHLWYGPFNESDETAVQAALIANEVMDAIEADVGVFSIPEAGERTPGVLTMTNEPLHNGPHHHGMMPLESTATQFKVT